VGGGWRELLSSQSGESLITNGGKRVSLDSLKGKVVGLYFSAHWYTRSFLSSFSRMIVLFWTEAN
jgi:hypothetical protein